MTWWISVVMAAVAGACAAQCTTLETHKILAGDGTTSDKFGFAVALSGTTAVVGAIGVDNDAGAAYVFTEEGTNWIERAAIKPLDNEASDRFGWSVAIDSGTIAVGRREDDDQGGNAGAVYVYIGAGDTWTQQTKLLANDGSDADLLGSSVALDGDTLAAGATGVSSRTGAVYVFVRDAGTWRCEQKIMPTDGAPLDGFGWSVALQGDTLAIGSIGDDDAGDRSGSVYIFSRSNGAWMQTDKFSAPDGSPSDNFGVSLALQGTTLVVGAPGDDDMGPTSGSASVFSLDKGTWTFEDKLVASDGVDNAQFGESCDIDGTFIAVGAANDDAMMNASGSAYVFENAGGNWVERSKLIASDGGLVDSLGGSVGLRNSRLLVGAQNDDDNGNNSGSVMLFNAIDDCNGNGVLDACDIDAGEPDADANGVLDVCETCVPDCNADGLLNSSDLLCFLGLWVADDPAANCNGDGLINTFDVLCFLNAYNAGC